MFFILSDQRVSHLTQEARWVPMQSSLLPVLILAMNGSNLCDSSKSYTILFGGRNLDKADAAAKEVPAKLRRNTPIISTVHINLEDDISTSQAFENADTICGPIDVLIRNGG